MSGDSDTSIPSIPRLAAFAGSLRERPLPADVEEVAVRLLADAVACAVFGARFPWCKAVRAQTELDPNAALPISPATAPTARRAEALVWGVQAHAFELDSLRKPGAGVHPGATVALPALAVARAIDARGKDLVRAIVAGCEVMFRIGAATLHTPEKRGFHAPGLTGPFGAAVATGVLLGLTEREMANALGIAASTGGGLLAFSRSEGGGMVKRLHLGRAAEAGVLAAQLASAGFEGPATALEGRFGLLEAYCDASEAERLTAGLGETWEIRSSCLKRYACHVTAHPPVEALRRLMREEGFAAEDIANMALLVPAKVASHHAGRRPHDVMQAQYSVPFMLATAACHDLSDPRSLSDAVLTSRQVIDLCDRIDVKDGQADGLKGWESDLRVTLRDGRDFQMKSDTFPGTPDTPMSAPQLREKFLSLVRDDLADPDGAFETLLAASASGKVSDNWAVLS